MDAKGEVTVAHLFDRRLRRPTTLTSNADGTHVCERAARVPAGAAFTLETSWQ
jgi:hypothetical protein